MIDGLAATWVADTDELKEIELRANNEANDKAHDEADQLVLTTVLVVGPPDPNALSYLVPRAVFERGHPVHVGALDLQGDLLEGMLEILEVMNPHDIVVFICDSNDTLTAAIDLLEPQHRSGHET